MDLREKIEALQNEIQNYGEIDMKDHFQDMSHLTLCMLTLSTKEQKQKAKKLMEEIRNQTNAFINKNFFKRTSFF